MFNLRENRAISKKMYSFHPRLSQIYSYLLISQQNSEPFTLFFGQYAFYPNRRKKLWRDSRYGKKHYLWSINYL
jgi:hypothetical protein